MTLRKQKLLDSLQVQQLFRDIEDEEAWIREKEPVAGSTNRGMHFEECRDFWFNRFINFVWMFQDAI